MSIILLLTTIVIFAILELNYIIAQEESEYIINNGRREDSNTNPNIRKFSVPTPVLQRPPTLFKTLNQGFILERKQNCD